MRITMSNLTPATIARRRLGGWLPADEEALSRFRAALAQRASARNRPAELCPPVQALATAIADTPTLRMGLTLAIEQATAYTRRHGLELGYATIGELMVLIDELMTYAPPFSTSALVGCPINALLDWPMCMPSGFAVFRSEIFNARIRDVLTAWGQFLSSPASRGYLNRTPPTGWFCPEADWYVNLAQFECDLDRPDGGFESWNAFFTRAFRPGMRPIAGPDDPRIVVAACEATPYNLLEDVQLQDAFWAKGQPYSLRDIFSPAQAPLAEAFVGGTVFQAFLSAYNYHRWHAPVAGKVVASYNVPGTYYSDAAAGGLDPAGPDDSQGYLTAVAARSVIVIDTGGACGRVACVFVGMAEVSSCVRAVEVGQVVQKGELLGYFQFGGSTHCLIFQPGAIASFVPQKPFTSSTPVIRLGAQIATSR